MPSSWLLSRKGRQENQAIFSPFVHCPKCVLCMEMQTKQSANGKRLTLDQYNSQHITYVLLRRGTAKKNALRGYFCNHTFRHKCVWPTKKCIYCCLPDGIVHSKMSLHIQRSSFLQFQSKQCLTFPHVLLTHSNQGLIELVHLA